MTANQINFAKHQEDVRTHKVVEGETAKHNRAQESIGWADVGVRRGQLQETIRHNLSDEQIRTAIASNQASYWDQLGTAAMANASTNAYNATTNREQLEETIRHNLEQEGIDASRADSIAKQAAAAIMQAETAESRRITDRNLGYARLIGDAVGTGVHEFSSLAQSIIRSGAYTND